MTWTPYLLALSLALVPATIQDESFESLEREFDEAVVEWIRGLSGHGPSEVPYPSEEFWPRYRALAEQGDARATAWLLRNVPDQHRDDVPWLFERVREAGAADWVAEVLPHLARWSSRLDAAALETMLAELAAPTCSKTLRVAAMLALGDLAQSGKDDAAALSWRHRAILLDLEGSEMEAGAVLTPDVAERLTEVILTRIQEDQGAWWELAIRDIDGSSWLMPNAPPEPKEQWRTRIESLADAGSSGARIWCLSWPGPLPTPASQERMERHLASLVDADLSAENIAELAGSVSGLIYRLDVDVVEPLIVELADQAGEDQRPMILYALGDALCDGAGEEAERRDRGLSYLREVAEDYPDSSQAERARGKVYRYTHLVVGKKAPDFEATDVDGNAFKLSDYAGKVTVLDFWGFW